MPTQYTVDLSLEDCVKRLNDQQKAIQLDNGYSLAITVKPVPIGTGAYRVEITRNIRGWRRGRKSAIYVFLKRTGGTITQVQIRNAEQITPMILGALLLGFGIILAFRGLYLIAGICLILGTVVLVILWLLYSGRLIPRYLVELVTQTLPARS
jgi:hypothetical protein